MECPEKVNTTLDRIIKECLTSSARLRLLSLCNRRGCAGSYCCTLSALNLTKPQDTGHRTQDTGHTFMTLHLNAAFISRGGWESEEEYVEHRLVLAQEIYDGLMTRQKI